MQTTPVSILVLTKLLIFPILVNADLPYCEPCKQGFTKLAEFFVTEDSLERQIEVLGAFVCDGSDDACGSAIRKWWPSMAR